MSALSIQPTYPIFTDIDGQPLEDGYVWIGGANLAPIGNPITVYWDAALTIPAAQPIRTRGGYPVNSGTPARLYVNSDYSIQVQNKNGSSVYSAPTATERYSEVVVETNAANVIYDPAGTGAVATNVQSKLREFVSVKDFGAVGDGVADDTAAIQAAINAATGKKLFFPVGTYRLTAGLTVSSAVGLVLDPSATLDYSGVAAGTSLGQRIAVTFSGAVGSDFDVTANIAARATTISLASTTGLAANDWILVRSNDPYAPGGDPSQGTLGHIARVRTVNSGTQITTWEPSPFAYTESLNLRITKVTMLEGASIEGGRILCGGVGSVHSGVRFNYCDTPMCRGVSVDGAEDSGVSFANCVAPQVHNCDVVRSTSPGGAVGNTGYAIAVYGGVGGNASGNRLYNSRHAIAGGGFSGVVSLGFEFIGNDVSACGFASALTWAVDCHEPCYNWKFIGNTISGCHGGAVLRGPGTVFSSNTVRDTVVGGVHVQQFLTNSIGLPRITVSDNVIENTGSFGIRALGHGYGTDKIINLVLSGNQVSGTGDHAILLDYTFGATLSSNIVSNIGGSGRHAVYVRNSERVSISGGQYDSSLSTNGNGIAIENSSRVTINGAHLIGSAAATNQDGIRSYGSGTNNSIIVNGCYIGGFSRYAIYTTNSDRVILTSNDVRDVVGGTKILISGATTSVNTNNVT